MRDWENIKCEIERLKFKKENLQEWKMVEKWMQLYLIY